jgi:hypothetical protein
MGQHIIMTIDGARYVAIPEAEYRILRGEEASLEDGVAWARKELGRTLRRAREHAGLTQGELAKRMRKSQSMVSRAEAGDVSVADRYVAAVLKACGLPKDWGGED